MDDDTFIETLKLRQAEATRRLQAAQQKFQVAQNELNIAVQQAQSWNVALAAEMHKVQQEAAAQGGQQAMVELPKQTPTSAPPPPPTPIATSDINKTDLVRNVLRQHPDGIRPSKIFIELSNQITAAYVHSVLHRLMSSGEIGRKRGKYYLKQPQLKEQVEEEENGAEQNGIIQQH